MKLRAISFVLLALAVLGCGAADTSSDVVTDQPEATSGTPDTGTDGTDGTDGADGADGTEGTDGGTDSTDEGTDGTDPCEGTGASDYTDLVTAEPMPEDVPEECVEIEPDPNLGDECCYHVVCIDAPFCAEAGECEPFDDVKNELFSQVIGGDFCDCNPLDIGTQPRAGDEGECCYVFGKVQCL